MTEVQLPPFINMMLHYLFAFTQLLKYRIHVQHKNSEHVADRTDQNFMGCEAHKGFLIISVLVIPHCTILEKIWQ
jgi:hypothetical protein